MIGIGNTLAGDDGAGVVCVERLRERWGHNPEVLLRTLDGDLFAVADLIDRVDRLMLVDAVAVAEGAEPGAIIRGVRGTRALAPSLHQVDVATVMASLEALGYDLPPWEIWGVTIEPPQELGEGLSPAVAASVDALAQDLEMEIAHVASAASGPSPQPRD